MTPVNYIVGRKGVSFYKFRERPIETSWVGFSDNPKYDDAKKIAARLHDFVGTSRRRRVDEIHIVYTHFVNHVVQEARVIRVVPLEVVDEVVDTSSGEGIPVAKTRVVSRSGRFMTLSRMQKRPLMRCSHA